MWKMVGDPKNVLPFLKGRLKRAEVVPDQDRFWRAISELDDNRFRVRTKATQDLEQLGQAAEPALREALRRQPSPEAQRRIEALLQRLEGPVTGAEQLAPLRAVEALDHIGTPEAYEQIEKLADGAADARLTQEAKRTLARLARARE